MNKVYIAVAGSGKTTRLIDIALESTERVLITTYTVENSKEIRKKFIEKCGYVPHNVTIEPWFSFLINHGVKPYQNHMTTIKMKGMCLKGERSAKYARGNSDEYYFDVNKQIYNDKVSKFVIECNKKSEGLVMSRLEKIFSHILIDEIQDLAGYDFEVLYLLFGTNIA